MEAGDFYNLKRLFHLREILEGLNPDHPPEAVIVGGPKDLGRRIGILSGSFNPPTLAHVELARLAQESFRLDHILFSVSRVTIDKERVEGLSLEDRLLLLSLMAEASRWASVAAVNRGLYFEQARAFRPLLGKKARMFFVVGMDKVMQIFDPRYYRDREAALKGLFTEAQLLAANRGPWGREELERLLARAENQPYQDRVYPMPFPEEMGEIASSALRGGLAEGESVKGHLPEVVERFVAESGAYRSPYEFRSRLLDRLSAVREWAEVECDFQVLVEIAGEDTERGQRLRESLRSDAISSSQLKDTISALLTPGRRPGYGGVYRGR